MGEDGPPPDPGPFDPDETRDGIDEMARTSLYAPVRLSKLSEKLSDQTSDEDLELIEAADLCALFTEEELNVIASVRRLDLLQVKVLVGRAVRADARPVLAGLREDAQDRTARQAWEARRERVQARPLSGAAQQRRLIESLETGEALGGAVEDVDALIIASALDGTAGLALLRGGRMILDSKQEALEQYLETLRGHRERCMTDLDRSRLVTDVQLELVAWSMDLDRLWARDGDRAVGGVEPVEEAKVRLGRLLEWERTSRIEELVIRAHKEWDAYLSWESDSGWTREETEHLAAALRVTLRAAAVRIGTRLRAPELLGYRAAVEAQRHLSEWTRPDDLAVLAAEWDRSDFRTRERIASWLREGPRGLTRLENARARAGDVAARWYDDHLDALEELGWEDDHAEVAAEMYDGLTHVDVREMVGGLHRGGETAKLGELVAVVQTELARGVLPYTFTESGHTPADAAEMADRAEVPVRTMVVEIARRKAIELAAKDVASALSDLHGAVSPDVRRRAEVLSHDDVKELREAGGRGPDACMAAFAESRTWWDDDAEPVAELRGVTLDTAREYIGHRLLAGREEQFRSDYVDDRIEELSLARGEDPDHPYVVLVLQGGGAKAAYQVGVYQALRDWGLEPSWILGISSGALNAAVIAGNPASRRLEQLGALWSKLTNPFVATEKLRPNLRPLAKIAGAFVPFKPNFWHPNLLPPFVFPPGSAGATSLVSVEPLRRTMGGLVDFERLHREGEIHRRAAYLRRHRRAPIRLTLGTTQVASGKGVWFENTAEGHRLTVEHILASGALPPGPGIWIDGRLYWDGGVLGNNPLEPVLDEMIEGTLNGREVLVVLVDLWSVDEWEPRSYLEVGVRQAELDYMARVDASMDRFRNRLLLELERRREREKERFGRGRRRRSRYGSIDPRGLRIVRLEDGRRSPVGSIDPMDFSAASIADRRARGAADMVQALTVLERPEERGEDGIGGVIHQFRRGSLIGRTEAVDTRD